MSKKIVMMTLFHRDCSGCEYFSDKKDCPQHKAKIKLMKQLRQESMLHDYKYKVKQSKDKFQIVNERIKVKKNKKTVEKLSICKVNATINTIKKEMKMITDMLRIYLLTVYDDGSVRITIFNDIEVDGNKLKCIGGNEL